MGRNLPIFTDCEYFLSLVHRRRRRKTRIQIKIIKTIKKVAHKVNPQTRTIKIINNPHRVQIKIHRTINKVDRRIKIQIKIIKIIKTTKIISNLRPVRTKIRKTINKVDPAQETTMEIIRINRDNSRATRISKVNSVQRKDSCLIKKIAVNFTDALIMAKEVLLNMNSLVVLALFGIKKS